MARKKLPKHQQVLMDKIIEMYKRDRLEAITYVDKYFRILCQILPLADPDYDLLGFMFEDLRKDARKK